MPAPDIPPPGTQLAFAEYARLITEELRRCIPEIRAASKGHKIVIWRYDGRVATLVDDAGTYWFTFAEGEGQTKTATMSSLYDRDRKDWFTAGNFAQSLAGYFDPKFSVQR